MSSQHNMSTCIQTPQCHHNTICQYVYRHRSVITTREDKVIIRKDHKLKINRLNYPPYSNSSKESCNKLYVVVIDMENSVDLVSMTVGILTTL